MKLQRKILRVTLILILLLVCLLTFKDSGQLATAQGGNLLQNPGFEGAFQAWSGIPEVQVAASWTPWWWEDPDHNPAYFRPEYKRALAAVFPRRVFSGESAQQWFTFHASHVAGMYQQVFNVTPGQRYRFSIWAQVWSSAEDNPYQSISPANPHLQIGIDPTGNWNPSGPTVIWSGEAPMSGVIDQWGLMAVEATAENTVITVFMRTNPDFANKHNDMYWDNAALEAVQPPQPTAPPSSTPGPATNTPVPTATSAATATPAATNTPTTTATATESPTAIPTPTATATPTVTPTNTAEPTATSPATATQSGSLASTIDEDRDKPTAGADEQGELPEQQARPGTAEPDSLGVVALVAIGVAIALLGLLILILVRELRAR